MKRYLFNSCLCALALSGLLLASCDSEPLEIFADVPSLTVSSAITVSSESGSHSFTYGVTNAASDGQLSCSADVSWISGVSASAGSGTFSVSENQSETLRTGNIVLTYGYTDEAGKNAYVIEKIGVIQYASGSPALSVQPNSVTASYLEGDYSLAYTISNAASDGELTCTSDAGWLGDFDYSTFGSVGFSVERNDGVEIRTATITVTYTYDKGYESLTKLVTVIQDHPGAGTVDVSDVVGTYEAYGTVYGQNYSTPTETSWTLRIFPYSGDGDYDLYIDGILPMCAYYDTYLDFRAAAAAYYVNSTIVVPSQVYPDMPETTLSGATYYLCNTPCSGYYDGGYYSVDGYPDLTYVYDEATGTWESDYGVFAGGCSDPADITSFYSFFQVAVPTLTMTRISDATSVSGSSSVISHPLTEGLQLYSSLTAR